MSCCHTGTTYVYLVEGGVCDINNNAVKVIEGPSTHFGYSNNCSLTALLKVGPIFMIFCFSYIVFVFTTISFLKWSSNKHQCNNS